MGTLETFAAFNNSCLIEGLNADTTLTRELCGLNLKVIFSRVAGVNRAYSCTVSCDTFVSAPVWECDLKLKLTARTDSTENSTQKFLVTKSSTSLLKSRSSEGKVTISSESDEVPIDRWLVCDLELTVDNCSFQRNAPFVVDFSDSDLPHDRILIVEGTKLHVQSAILSMCSPFFNTLFNGNFKESEVKEIALDDVQLAEFNDMLMMIYPTNSVVTVTTVGHLLKLADRFDVPSITANCDRFLTNLKIADMPLLQLVELVGRYKLAGAQMACMTQINNYGCMTDLITANRIQFDSLCNEAKVFLMEAFLSKLIRTGYRAYI